MILLRAVTFRQLVSFSYYILASNSEFAKKHPYCFCYSIALLPASPKHFAFQEERILFGSLDWMQFFSLHKLIDILP